MNFNNMDGVFGTSDNIPNYDNNGYTQGSRRRAVSRRSNIEPLRLVDIICCSVIGISILLVIIFWRPVMDAIFLHFMFPYILVVSKLTIVAVIVGLIGGLLYFRFGRRRRWYW